MAISEALLESAKLTPSSILELFVLDATSIGLTNTEIGSDGVYRFHAGTNQIIGDIVFDKMIYHAFPVEASGFQYDGKGQLPRPTLRCANINGYISNLVIKNQNLLGAKVIRKRVFARFIDDCNFPTGKNPFGTPNSNGAFADDIFYVNRKANENSVFVEFELATQLEIDNVTIPKRKLIANVCMWKYRGEGCRYSGNPVANNENTSFVPDLVPSLTDRGEWSASTTYNTGDFVSITSTLELTSGEKLYFVCLENNVVGVADKPTISSKWSADQCTRTIAGCKKRFTGVLPFGGFPGVSRLPF